MNVLFINCVLSNTGDAAIFQAAAAVMRRAWGPDTKFVVQDDHPQRVAEAVSRPVGSTELLLELGVHGTVRAGGAGLCGGCVFGDSRSGAG